MFDVPAAFNEFHRQPIQQFRMGRVPLDTEILAGGNQTFPEHLLPKSIDLNPCREWVMRGDKPMGQIETIDSRVRFGGMNAFG